MTLRTIFFAILFILPVTAYAQTTFKNVERTQFIAALGDPNATSGNGAEKWGHWPVDPGPRGVWLKFYPILHQMGGFTPAGWQFDPHEWWVDENGLLMEKPTFPLKPGKYRVTGDRPTTATLTIHPSDADGNRKWELEGGKLYDVTHLPCRSAKYTPASVEASCIPSNMDRSVFKLPPGSIMPSVEGCKKQDYSVLFITGVEE